MEADEELHIHPLKHRTVKKQDNYKGWGEEVEADQNWAAFLNSPALVTFHLLSLAHNHPLNANLKAVQNQCNY